MQNLMDSGKVQEVYEVYLEDVPILFFQNAPLIGGKWLDRKIVELAEWGALLKANGYQICRVAVSIPARLHYRHGQSRGPGYPGGARGRD